MSRKFTWFPKLTRVVERVPNIDDQGSLALAMMFYGTDNAEPNLPYPLNALFESVRDDIDNSVNARENNTGGRRKKKTEDAPLSFTPVVTDEENGGFDSSESGVSDEENGGLENSCETETPPYIPSQSSISQSKVEQKESNATQRFRPPTPDEVNAYANERGAPAFDAERFCDFYSSKGWKVGKSTMKDWKASVRNWLKSDDAGKDTGNAKFSEYAGKF